MARSAEQVRKQIADERALLVDAVGQLRSDLHEATDVASRLPALPALAAGGLAAGFLLGGGLGATARLLFGRARAQREGGGRSRRRRRGQI